MGSRLQNCYQQIGDEKKAYLTVSTSAMLVLASVLLIDLLFGGGIFLFLPWLARLVVLPDGHVAVSGGSDERMTVESYTTLSWNQLPVTFKAGRWLRGRCIGSKEEVFGFNPFRGTFFCCTYFRHESVYMGF